jgi:pimeloyl-ACP methyl ester carboxylesterase
MAALMAQPASDSRADRIATGLNVLKVLGSPGYPDPEEAMLASVSAAVDRAPFDPAGVARQMAAIVAAAPRNDKLKSVRAPALVIHGAEDPIIPAPAGEDTAACIPGARLVIVPGMAHDFTAALVPVYLKHIGDFAASVEAKAKAA